MADPKFRYACTDSFRIEPNGCILCILARIIAVALAAIAACALAAFPPPAAAQDVLRVGSKRFTESYILGEILAQTAAQHARTEHRQGLGNTAILFEALKAGSIDLYPEYLGTIDLEILKHTAKPAAPASIEGINRELAPLGLGVAVNLGFSNTYALAMRGEDSRDRGIRTLSQLARHADARLGLSHEFLGRIDGWPGLSRTYALPQRPRGLDHGIAYEALASRQVDVIDIYSTDAKIARLGLQVLEDDRRFFPRYDAVVLYRLDIARRFPDAWRRLQQLEGRISNDAMIAMNGEAEIDGRPFPEIARRFLAAGRTAPPQPGNQHNATQAKPATGLWSKLFDDSFWRLTREHIVLVLVSLTAAAAAGIPMGVAAAFLPRLRQAIFAVTGMLQTIPSLALLAMLIPLLGNIGMLPALVALFLYSLLPIVRNTCIGIIQVPAGLRMAALGLGLTPRDRLLEIDLPLAAPVILAGVKIAAVTSVGTATIAAFIGAGGYGERIATGLALNDNEMLLAGALPAAVLALATQLVFELAEAWLLRSRKHG